MGGGKGREIDFPWAASSLRGEKRVPSGRSRGSQASPAYDLMHNMPKQHNWTRRAHSYNSVKPGREGEGQLTKLV